MHKHHAPFRPSVCYVADRGNDSGCGAATAEIFVCSVGCGDRAGQLVQEKIQEKIVGFW